MNSSVRTRLLSTTGNYQDSSNTFLDAGKIIPLSTLLTLHIINLITVITVIKPGCVVVFGDVYLCWCLLHTGKHCIETPQFSVSHSGGQWLPQSQSSPTLPPVNTGVTEHWCCRIEPETAALTTSSWCQCTFISAAAVFAVMFCFTMMSWCVFWEGWWWRDGGGGCHDWHRFIGEQSVSAGISDTSEGNKCIKWGLETQEQTNIKEIVVKKTYLLPPELTRT